MDQDQRNYIDEAVAREREARIHAEHDLLTERDRRIEARFRDLERYYDQRIADIEKAVRVALDATRTGPPWHMVIGALLAIVGIVALLALTSRGVI